MPKKIKKKTTPTQITFRPKSIAKKIKKKLKNF